MYSYKVKSLPKQTKEIEVTIPQKDIQEEYQKAFEELRKNLKSEGFRKGKVPKDVAEKQIKKEDVYNQLLRTYIPVVYSEIVKKDNLKPIAPPNVSIQEASEDKDWKLKITIAEEPTVDLGDYKAKIRKAKEEVEKSDIWVPGKDKELSEKDKERQKAAALQKGLDALLKEAKVEISDMLISEEVDKRLAQLVDDIQKTGLTMDSYLKSRNMTKEKLREQYIQEIEETYKLEFILQEIADKENITVDDRELTSILEKAKTDEEKRIAQQNQYYYAALLRKQKVLEYINSL